MDDHSCCDHQHKDSPQKLARPEPSDAVYTCPMHPEIRQVGPGTCPKCGMALEPVEVGAEEEENVELKDMSRRFWISLGLTVPVVLLAMGGMLLSAIPIRLSIVIQMALATPVVLWGGWPF